jgi:DNA-binding CsgD family transcriptional regulator
VRALIDLRVDPAAVVGAICRALDGEMVYPESDEEVRQRSRRVRLTPREGQLIALLVQGLKNKEIAAQLELSEGTVKVYLSKLFQKVGAKDRFELALFGLRNLVNGEFGCMEPGRQRKPARPVREPERHGLRTLVVGRGGSAWVAKAGSAG